MFNGSRLKIQRANTHIQQLKEAVEAFIGDNAYSMITYAHPQGGLLIGLKGAPRVPNEFALIIGDAIHNLRTALDHATWELIGLDGGTQDRWTKLPVSSTGQVDYEAACRGLKTPRQETKDFFIDLKVYEGSGSPLYALHLLDNTDKHMILLPMLAAAAISKVRFLHPDGSIAATMTNCSIRIDENGSARLAALGPGMAIETDNDTKVTPAIFFAPDQPCAREPVVPTLETLANEASVALDAFERFVTARK